MYTQREGLITFRTVSGEYTVKIQQGLFLQLCICNIKYIFEEKKRWVKKLQCGIYGTAVTN